MNRVFISGPMTGHPEMNYPAFHAKAEELASGWAEVVNPALNTGTTWEEFMRAAISQIVTCDAVHFLPGWQQSRGSRLEHKIAKELGLHIVYPSGEAA